MNLSNLPKISGHKRKSKRLGRGYSSGRGGHTTVRGQKGQKSRGRVKYWFEGGQKPLIHRLPYLGGFKHTGRSLFVINLEDLDRIYNDGETVSVTTLIDKGVLKKPPFGGVKILGRGKLSKKLQFDSEISFSASARAIIFK